MTSKTATITDNGVAAALAEIDDLSVNELASMADCASPDDADSPGAGLLRSVRDAFVEAVRRESITLADCDYNGQAHEIADDAPSVYTHRKWLEFVDLCAYQEEPEIDDNWGANLDTAASVALYQIAERLVHTLHDEYVSAWQCQGCESEYDPHTSRVLQCDEEGCAYAPDPDEDNGAQDGAQVSQATPVEAVLTGPVDLPVLVGPFGETAQVKAETDSDMRRVDAMVAGHLVEVKATRVMVWAVAAVLAVVGVMVTLGLML